jgi:hypothetical protein
MCLIIVVSERKMSRSEFVERNTPLCHLAFNKEAYDYIYENAHKTKMAKLLILAARVAMNYSEKTVNYDIYNSLYNEYFKQQTDNQ